MAPMDLLLGPEMVAKNMEGTCMHTRHGRPFMVQDRLEGRKRTGTSRELEAGSPLDHLIIS